jgi:membrane protease YdiL (CAAX protease family)
MVGVIVQLIISWGLLWWYGKKDLSVLGFRPTRNRMVDLLFGLLAGSVCYATYAITTSLLTDNHWTINSNFTILTFAKSFGWTFNSVLFEELLFRGALLFILIEKVGTWKACWISSIAFGIYHWFTFGGLGNPVQMAYVFLTTGWWGWMFAWAYTKTKSLYLPIGLHFGWNFLNIVIFSQGPLGLQLFINSDNGQRLTGILSLMLFLFQLFALPLASYLYLRKKRNEINTEKTYPGN